MLYQLELDIPEHDDSPYHHTVVEAPAHRKGIPPKGLVAWAETTWAKSLNSGTCCPWRLRISVYTPLRVGYPGQSDQFPGHATGVLIHEQRVS